jgi:two-component system, response regulator PdtaR
MAGSPSKSPPVVLIVENDPLLRVLAVEVVEEAGLMALEAGNAPKRFSCSNLAGIFRCSPT